MAKEMKIDDLAEMKEAADRQFYNAKPEVEKVVTLDDIVNMRFPEEKVNHPKHYNWISGIECLDVAENFNFNLGCVLKYVWRCPTRNHADAEVDMRKAIFYLEREIERIQIEED